MRTLRRRFTRAAALASAAAVAMSCLVLQAPSKATETGWNSSITAVGDMYPVRLLSLTDNTSEVRAPDTGVATYVGGNMYIGQKIGSTPGEVQSNLNVTVSPSNTTDTTASVPATQGITGTYAAEAEGLTVVDGRLMLRQLKYSWTGRGFRFGIAGYGTQFRPADGMDAEGNVYNNATLAVRGNDDSGITSLFGSQNLSVGSWDTDSVDYGDYTDPTSPNYGMNNYGGGWIGDPSSTDLGDSSSFYYAALTNKYTSVACEDGAGSACQYSAGGVDIDATTQLQPDGKSRHALAGVQGKRRSRLNDFWRVNGMGGRSTTVDGARRYGTFLVNGTDYANFKTDTLQVQSSKLAKLASTGTASVSQAPAASALTRYKYDYYEDSSTSYSFAFDTSGLDEKLITFTGDGTSALQVFSLKASDLSDTLDGSSCTGVDFWFRNIPKDAAVVVNVVNDDGTSASTNTIDFHNGWRLWWGGDANSAIDDDSVREIGGGYSQSSADGADDTEEYVEHAQQLLWNFPYTTQLTVRGGQASGTQTTRTLAGNGAATTYSTQRLSATDDPAASAIGSIFVPNGGFQSHVSTNGRVYVGQDFEMSNPAPIRKADGTEFINAEHSGTASLIDMDQERHNLPWYGVYFDDASTLEWGKADVDTKTALAGSSWSVYGTLDDARNGTHAILSVTDNGINDYAPRDGEIAVRWLKPNANYYIVETVAPTGYQRSTNIYTAQTTKNGYSINTLTSRVYDAAGNEIADDSNNAMARSMNDVTFSDGTAGYAVADANATASVSWTKYDSEDTAQGDARKGLSGSVWTLTRTQPDAGGTPTSTSWTVADNTIPATAVIITKTDGSAVGETEYIDAYQRLTLKATLLPGDAYQGVTWSSSDASVAVVSDGTVTGTGGGNATITACAATTPGVCASLKVQVASANVARLAVYTIEDGTSPIAVVDDNAQSTASVTASTAIYAGARTQLIAKVDPDPTKAAWSSLDPTVASVDSNGLVTGEAAGTTTIVVAAGNKTVRLNIEVIQTETNEDGTVKDMFLVYLHKGTNTWTGSRKWAGGSWSDGTWTDDAWNTDTAHLRYQFGLYDWGDEPMKAAPCSDDYLYAVVDENRHNTIAGWTIDPSWQFLFTNADQSAWYKTTAGGNFSYADDGASSIPPAITVADSVRSDGAPAGCPAGVTLDMLSTKVLDQGAPSQETNGSTAGSSTGASGTATGGVTTGGAAPDGTAGDAMGGTDPTLADADPGVGRFTVSGLEDGSYTLRERTAPAGYTKNTTEYSFTVVQGKVAWSGSAAAQVTDGRLYVPDSPTRFTWYKTDADATDSTGAHPRVGGSQWKIVAADGATYCVADGGGAIDPSTCQGAALDDSHGDDGVIGVERLPVGTYTLMETLAPRMYKASDDVYSFTIDDDANGTVQLQRSVTDGTTGSATLQAVQGNEVQDGRQLGSVVWNKTDAGGERLAGSRWTLTFVPQGGSQADAVTKDIVDWDADAGSADGVRPAECDGNDPSLPWSCDVDDASGGFRLTNLPWGTYTLTETKAPANHQVARNATVTFTIGAPDAGGAGGASAGAALDAINPDLGDIVNEETVGTLPATGGKGMVVALIAILGTLLVVIGVLIVPHRFRASRR
ncbi:MAG: SpaA isopeptide-forming pilin-related protein [Pseudoscardovia radai]|nr:SpaA isopeptide-forming pilin-related protein [Pseudoscardovia radai]